MDLRIQRQKIRSYIKIVKNGMGVNRTVVMTQEFVVKQQNVETCQQNVEAYIFILKREEQNFLRYTSSQRSLVKINRNCILDFSNFEVNICC